MTTRSTHLFQPAGYSIRQVPNNGGGSTTLKEFHSLTNLIPKVYEIFLDSNLLNLQVCESDLSLVVNPSPKNLGLYKRTYVIIDQVNFIRLFKDCLERDEIDYTFECRDEFKRLTLPSSRIENISLFNFTYLGPVAR